MSQRSDRSPSPRYRSEGELQAAIVRRLAADGVAIRPRVVCAVGMPDIVTQTGDAIFEVKWRLTRSALYQAIGQVLLYRVCLNPDARAIVVGYPTPEAAALLPYITGLGVEVVCWEDHDDPMVKSAAQLQNLGSTRPSRPQAFRPLRWRVAAQARTLGISNPARLATKLGTDRQGLYAIWNDTAHSASLTTIGKLCALLKVEPGDWFEWQDGKLVWNIAKMATERGLDQSRLSYRSELHQKTITQIWRGKLRIAYIDTLSRLAWTLGRPDRLFSPGGLFTWDDPATGKMKDEG